MSTPQCHHMCVHAAHWTRLSAAHTTESAQPLSLAVPSGNKPAESERDAPLVYLHRHCVCLSAVCSSIRNFSDSLLSSDSNFLGEMEAKTEHPEIQLP